MIRHAMSALVTLITVATALPAGAVNFDQSEIQKVNPYRDLPGVKDGGDAVRPKCSSEVRMVSRIEGVAGGNSTAPMVVYTCEHNGVTFESTRPPTADHWIPGVHHRSLNW
ncbi:hypothetical protein MRS76_12655 [Rhizobiaceae bacterium n13]|uniref:Ig-like domain-containing protein n=1 Tax=Ferirhizobium litorale TaxID=2927786 RepID=A0AAE3QIW0_9HYPH|nr:hypothetical protein [Fererhizobium litorale]MDI7862809.1 hypothetical protein [Fererhizobium litorale]MDI7923913.1 hypothetical protein [Fererhizobium litorale]